MAYTATHRFARISAQKVRPLANLIRGKHADEALEILKYMPHRGARMLEKVLKSALGNAEDLRAANISAAGGGRCPRGWRPDREAHPAACPRHGVHDQEADGAYPRAARCGSAGVSREAVRPKRRTSDSDEFRIQSRTKGNHVWVKKSIRSDSASASWKAGKAAGMPRSRNSRNC